MRYIRYCPSCKEWFDTDSEKAMECPKCGFFIRQAKCNRCGAEWNLKGTKYPKNCTNCKAPGYNRRRREDRKGDE